MFSRGVRAALPAFHGCSWYGIGSVPLNVVREFAADAAAATDPTDARKEFRAQVKEFAQRTIAPHAESIDKNNDFPKSPNLWREMGDFGLLGKKNS